MRGSHRNQTVVMTDLLRLIGATANVTRVFY